MSLRGYVKKGKPANWLSVAGAQRRREEMDAMAKGLRRQKPTNLKPLLKARKPGRGSGYSLAARAFVAAAAARGENCPVVAACPELAALRFYGHPVSRRLKAVHHSRGRGHGGRGPLLMDERFWIAMSTQGHRWVHDHPAWARERGFMCESGQWNVPVPADAVVRRNAFGGVEVEIVNVSRG